MGLIRLLARLVIIVDLGEWSDLIGSVTIPIEQALSGVSKMCSPGQHWSGVWEYVTLKFCPLFLTLADRRKFGKHIQKKQLEIPEYAAHFVDYKALKKLIKELKNSPVPRPQLGSNDGSGQDPQMALQANRGSFFFRLVRCRVERFALDLTAATQDRELGKVDDFYKIKEEESQTKEQYLSRAVEKQPVFNRDVISELSDKAAECLLECAAWAEGDDTLHLSEPFTGSNVATPRLEQTELDTDLLECLYRGDETSVRSLLQRLDASTAPAERITKAFVTAISEAPDVGLDILLTTDLVNLQYQDEINERNMLHKAAMTGRRNYLRVALAAGVDPTIRDAYGRIPLHYASMNGHVEAIHDLVHADPSTIDFPDLDNFTALIHAIVHSRLQSIRAMLSLNAQVNRIDDAGHIPLNLACQHGSLEVVEVLLMRRPAILPDAEGLFPQHLVSRFGIDHRLLLLLREHHVDLNQPDKLYGWTPLFHASSEGHVQCLRTLLDCGVDPDIKDEKGQSALYYATWEGHLECMNLLASSMHARRGPEVLSSGATSRVTLQPPVRMGGAEQIPDLSLPPPIIPTRRYGHNFLDNRSNIVITFKENNCDAVTFYDESKYPAARLTITPKPHDILPRNLLLPIQEDSRCISFETDNVADFALEFDIYPTFGKKVIARGSVPSDVFIVPRASAGYHHLSIFDPRLRAVGQMSFKFQIIEPFVNLPRDMTPFATYWKATSQLEDKPSSFVTGSSLSGDYVRIVIQPSRDNVPVVWPSFVFSHAGLTLPVSQFTASIFGALETHPFLTDDLCCGKPSLSALHDALFQCRAKVEDVLNRLDVNVNVELHVQYPDEREEGQLHLGQLPSINDFADSVLGLIFRHTKALRDVGAPKNRSVVLSSSNTDLCIALNWKQPNYPVLLCNNLGQNEAPTAKDDTTEPADISIKEAVRIATTNNFMGITCPANILRSVPALVEAIKEAGLVLVSDATKTFNERLSTSMGAIDGIVKKDGTLHFEQRLDV
ncbi:MAG: hypothetical protein Q9159_006207 [Coniocarpon cinnabarinum]